MFYLILPLYGSFAIKQAQGRRILWLAAIEHETYVDVAVNVAEATVSEATELVAFNEGLAQSRFKVLGGASNEVLYLV